MIYRAFRGQGARGLVAYLYGPGRANEHVGQRMIASWAGDEEFVLRGLDPARHVDITAAGALEGAEFRGRIGALTAELEAALTYNDRAGRQPVYHLAMSADPGDRILTDIEWADLAAAAMHETGIASHGDDAACRWVAVRHADNHIHVVAILARQDGAPLRFSNDHRKLAVARQAAETKYELRRTGQADHTAATHTTRQEREKATRAGLVPAREWLREQVQQAAAASTGGVEFFDRLRAAGVQVRVRGDVNDQAVGYAVGRREPGGGEPVWFSGGRLAADLSLPKLQHRWVALAPHAAAAGFITGDAGRPITVTQAHGERGQRVDSGGGTGSDVHNAAADTGEVVGGRVLDDPGDRTHVWDQAIAAAARAADEVRGLADTDPAGASDAASAAADVLAAAARLIEGDQVGPLTLAARDYDRAGREPYGRVPDITASGAALRIAAIQLARAARGPAKRGDAARVAMLIAQMARLAESVQRLREAQRRRAQQAAAGRAGATLTTDAHTWISAATTIRDQDLAVQAAPGTARPGPAVRPSIHGLEPKAPPPRRGGSSR